MVKLVENEFKMKRCKRVNGFTFEFPSINHNKNNNVTTDENYKLITESITNNILKCVKECVYNLCIHELIRTCPNATTEQECMKKNDNIINVENNNLICMTTSCIQPMVDEKAKLTRTIPIESISTNETINSYQSMSEPIKKLKFVVQPSEDKNLSHYQSYQFPNNINTTYNDNLQKYQHNTNFLININDEKKTKIHDILRYTLDEEDINAMRYAYNKLVHTQLTDHYIENKSKEFNITQQELISYSIILKDYQWVDELIPGSLSKTKDFIRDTYIPIIFEMLLSDETKLKMKDKQKIDPSCMTNDEANLYQLLRLSNAITLLNNNNISNNSCRLKSFTDLKNNKKLNFSDKIVKFLIEQRSTLKSNSLVTSNNQFSQLSNYRIEKSKTRKSNQLCYLDNLSVRNMFYRMKTVKKDLIFSKSRIHNWGLFATENIPKNEMIVEYTGEKIRNSVADHRERISGPDASSYFFRLDSEWVIDATNCGNYARFINHSCDPNCYAEVIEIDGEGKIVIYSKREIQAGEELTYDYNFPLEEIKIPCCCGAIKCRGSLN